MCRFAPPPFPRCTGRDEATRLSRVSVNSIRRNRETLHGSQLRREPQTAAFASSRIPLHSRGVHTSWLGSSAESVRQLRQFPYPLRSNFDSYAKKVCRLGSRNHTRLSEFVTVNPSSE